jgi:hypothetical protein
MARALVGELREAGADAGEDAALTEAAAAMLWSAVARPAAPAAAAAG